MKDWHLGCWFLIQKPKYLQCFIFTLYFIVNICSVAKAVFLGKIWCHVVKVISWQNVFKVLLLWCTILLCLIFAPAAWIKCNNVIMSDDHGVISCPKSFHYNCKYSFNITAYSWPHTIHTNNGNIILIMTAERKLIKLSLSQCRRWGGDNVTSDPHLYTGVQLTYFVMLLLMKHM